MRKADFSFAHRGSPTTRQERLVGLSSLNMHSSSRLVIVIAKEKAPVGSRGFRIKSAFVLHLFRALAGLSIPHAASLLAVCLSLRLGHICSESWDSEGEADSQSEN